MSDINNFSLFEVDKNYYINILDKHYRIFKEYLFPIKGEIEKEFEELKYYCDDYQLTEKAHYNFNIEYSIISSWICSEYQKWMQGIVIYLSKENLFNSLKYEDCFVMLEKNSIRTLLLNYIEIDVNNFRSWKKINEMRLVVNVIKHFMGNSYNELIKIRPDLFNLANAYDAKKIAITSGEFFLNLKCSDYEEYHNSLIDFWNELYIAMNQ